MDLLGFGESPKPKENWVNYSAQDQAKSVLYTLRKLKCKGSFMIVGHSMGCFVGVEVAHLKPGKVTGLILYEPPFYVGLPANNKYRLRLKAYFAIYQRIIRRYPKTLTRVGAIKALASKFAGFELSETTWIPFQRSMQNAILKQTALTDLKQLTTPTKILYGKYDHIVINDKNNLLFGKTAKHVSTAQLSAMHAISPKTSRLLAKIIRDQLSASAGSPVSQA